jgi:hypothetical protein
LVALQVQVPAVSTLHATSQEQPLSEIHKRHNPTADRYLTPRFHHTSQRHYDGFASHDTTTKTPSTAKALGTQQQQQQQQQPLAKQQQPHGH